jgi:hypothetical protein
VVYPNLFLAVNDFVAFRGTSEELAIGISILFTTAGAVDLVGVADGDGVGVCDAEGDGAGIVFPESHARTVLPFDFVLMQVYSLPLYVVFCPRNLHLTGGVVAASAGKAIAATVEINPTLRILREIGFTRQR